MSLFNPWIILAIIIAVLSSAVSGYYKGSADEYERQQLEIAKLNQEARQKEQALVSAVTTTATQLVKVNNNAKIEIAKRDAAIASGALRLRIPVQTSCPISTASDAPIASGNSVQARAELDSETARLIVAITDQGDANTRQLNACIDAYNIAYQTLKGTAK